VGDISLLIISFLIAGVILLIASIFDLLKREVNDVIWIIGIIIGLSLNTISVISGEVKLLTWVISIAIGFTLALISYNLKFLGGADSKAILTISVLLPIGLGVFNLFPSYIPLILEVYFYFLMLILLLAVLTLTYNIMTKAYTDIKNKPTSEKIKLLTLCFKKKNDKITENYRLIEKLEDGKLQINLKIKSDNINVQNKRLAELIKYKKAENMENSFWVYPNWPLIPLILLALIITLI